MNDSLKQIQNTLLKRGWFQGPGAYVLVDGAYGSTGKGALAALFGKLFGDKVNIVTTNAGPNSGHTGYVLVDGQYTKIQTQQIPVMAAVSRIIHPFRQIAYLNAGAVLNSEILVKEARQYHFNYSNLALHPNAAVIDHNFQEDAADSTAAIASTNKGVGRALARKVMRESNVVKMRAQDFAYFSRIGRRNWNWDSDVVFVETAQGFSLGINQQFYPYTTSRECTVGQALADAAIHPSFLRKTIMSVRAYPIRVGNTDKGSSGPCYTDQKEIDWKEIGVEPELTTVTKRVRRLFTWSRDQFRDALEANRPDVIFLNFVQYLSEDEQEAFIDQLTYDYGETMGHGMDCLLLGYGPYPEDVRLST